MDTNTAMWKWRNGGQKDHIWRLQTEDPKLIRKLQRRNSAHLAAWATNSNLCYFHLTYNSRFKAMQGLRRLTGQEVYYDAVNELILLKIAPILTLKK